MSVVNVTQYQKPAATFENIMTQSNFRELAQQGDPTALHTFINHLVQAQEVSAQTEIREDCLYIVLSSPAQIPDRQTFVELLRRELTQLEPDSINRVKISAKQTNQSETAWSHEFAIEFGAYSMIMAAQAPAQNSISEPQETSSKPVTSSSNYDRLRVFSIVLLSIAILLTVIAYITLKEAKNLRDTTTPSLNQ